MPSRGGALDATSILALQRAAGNRAADTAIQRAGPAAPARGPNVLPAYEPGRLPHKDALGRAGPGIGSLGSAVSNAGSVTRQIGKSDHLEKLSTAGAATGLPGYLVGAAGDAVTAASKYGELRYHRQDAEVAGKAGSAFWSRAARRQLVIKLTDVRIAMAKLVTSDADKIAQSAMSLAHALGTMGTQAYTAGASATGAIALPVQLVSVVRDFRKLIKQGFRLHRMRKQLYGPGSVNVAEAQSLVNKYHLELGLATYRADAQANAVGQLELDLDKYQATLRFLPEAERAQALQEIAAAEDELARARQDLARDNAEVGQAQAEKRKADEAYKLMGAGVTDLAAEIKGLDKGEAPSLKAIAYYAKVKSAKGTTRRTVKVIAGSLGIAAGVVALVALASGPGALVLGPIGIALGAAGALLGLGLATATAWRFLAKRWELTEGSQFDTAPTETGARETVYAKIRRLGPRVKATVSGKTKVRDPSPGPGREGAERKSHRKLMAAWLWEYATDATKYDDRVRQEAWAIITELTGRTRDEIVGPGVADVPNGPTGKTIRDGQKAAALKLLEDKLKSA